MRKPSKSVSSQAPSIPPTYYGLLAAFAQWEKIDPSIRSLRSDQTRVFIEGNKPQEPLEKETVSPATAEKVSLSVPVKTGLVSSAPQHSNLYRLLAETAKETRLAEGVLLQKKEAESELQEYRKKLVELNFPSGIETLGKMREQGRVLCEVLGSAGEYYGKALRGEGHGQDPLSTFLFVGFHIEKLEAKVQELSVSESATRGLEIMEAARRLSALLPPEVGSEIDSALSGNVPPESAGFTGPSNSSLGVELQPRAGQSEGTGGEPAIKPTPAEIGSLINQFGWDPLARCAGESLELATSLLGLLGNKGTAFAKALGTKVSDLEPDPAKGVEIADLVHRIMREFDRIGLTPDFSDLSVTIETLFEPTEEDNERAKNLQVLRFHSGVMAYECACFPSVWQSLAEILNLEVPWREKTELTKATKGFVFRFGSTHNNIAADLKNLFKRPDLVHAAKLLEKHLASSTLTELLGARSNHYLVEEDQRVLADEGVPKWWGNLPIPLPDRAFTKHVQGVQRFKLPDADAAARKFILSPTPKETIAKEQTRFLNSQIDDREANGKSAPLIKVSANMTRSFRIRSLYQCADILGRIPISKALDPNSFEELARGDDRKMGLMYNEITHYAHAVFGRSQEEILGEMILALRPLELLRDKLMKAGIKLGPPDINALQKLNEKKPVRHMSLNPQVAAPLYSYLCALQESAYKDIAEASGITDPERISAELVMPYVLREPSGRRLNAVPRLAEATGADAFNHVGFPVILEWAECIPDGKDITELKNRATDLQKFSGLILLRHGGLITEYGAKRANSNTESSEAIAAARVIVAKLIHTYDHRSGFRFSTYAQWYLEHEVARTVGTNPPVKLPQEYAAILGHIRAIGDSLGIPSTHPDFVTRLKNKYLEVRPERANAPELSRGVLAELYQMSQGGFVRISGASGLFEHENDDEYGGMQLASALHNHDNPEDREDCRQSLHKLLNSMPASDEFMVSVLLGLVPPAEAAHRFAETIATDAIDRADSLIRQRVVAKGKVKIRPAVMMEREPPREPIDEHDEDED